MVAEAMGLVAVVKGVFWGFGMRGLIWLTIEERREKYRCGGARTNKKERKTKTTARVTLTRRGIARVNDIAVEIQRFSGCVLFRRI
jgi:hypothetical protein